MQDGIVPKYSGHILCSMYIVYIYKMCYNIPWNGGGNMPYTEAQKAATIKYLNEKTDDIRLRVPKGTKDKWKHYAKLSDKSMTVYVCDAVERQIAFDETGENEIDPDLITNLISWMTGHSHTPKELVDCLKALGSSKSYYDTLEMKKEQTK